MNRIILVGIPGSGKSSVLQEFPSVPIVNYGDKMVEEAGIGRDSLRKLSFQEQQEIGIRAAKNMVQQKNHGVQIIDTHALVKTNAGYCPGLPLKVLEILAPKAYALVECAPELILERRGKDQTRRRDAETIKEIAVHQELTRAFLTACCMHTGSLLCLVKNNSPSLRENVRPLARLIESFLA